MLFKTPGTKRISIFFIAGLLLTAAYIFYRVKKHSFLQKQVKELVSQKTNNIYKINYDSISVNEAAGSLYIKNIFIKGDTLLQQQMINKGDTNAYPVIFDIYIPILKVTKFRTAAALLSKQMECSQILITDPQVRIYLFPGQKQQPTRKQYEKEIYKQILGNFSLIKADSVSIENSNVIATDFYTRETKFKTFQTSINASHLAIDSTYNEDTSRTFFCKKISFNSAKISVGEPNKNIDITNALFDTEKRVLHLESADYNGVKSGGLIKSLIKDISLKGFELKGPIENSEFAVDSIIIESGELEMPEASGKQKKKKDKRLLVGLVKQVSIKNILVNKVTYISRNTDKKKNPLIVTNNSFVLRDLTLNRESQLDASLVDAAKEVRFLNDKIEIKSSDGFYRYQMQNIAANTWRKELSIKSFRIIPQYSEQLFSQKAKYQKDRYDIQLNNIVCSGLSFSRLLKGEIQIGAITTNRSIIKVFHDLNYPIDSTTKRNHPLTYPHQVIHTLGFPIQVNKLSNYNTLVEYKEKNDKTKKSGRVRFSNSTVIIKNISTEQRGSHNNMTVAFKAKFLDTLPVSGGFTFLLNEWKKGSFTVSTSTTQEFDATLLNQLTEPMSSVKIEKGIIGPISFSLKGDTSISRGNISIPYKEMKVTLLRFKGDQIKEKGFFSLLANLLVKNNNKEGEKMRTAKVEVERNKYRSFFNFIWSTLFKGLKDIFLIK